jgi:hypothetical protein
MTRTLYKSAMGCLAVLMGGLNSFGQNAITDTSARQAKIDNIVANYYNTIGEQSRLFNGPEYNFYSKIIKNSAYFAESSDFVTGTVEYDGFTYKNLQLMYDLYKDAVVMQLPSKVASIQLISERVQSFDVLGHHFVRVEPALLVNAQNLTPGFYDEMYTGKTGFIIKREKVIQNNTSAALDTYFTDEQRKMYVHINGAYKLFTNKNSLLNVLGDKKDELKKYIKDNHINFREEKEEAFVKVITHYDQITKSI